MWLSYYTYERVKKDSPRNKIGKWEVGRDWEDYTPAALMIWGPLKCQTTSKQNYHYILRGWLCGMVFAHSPAQSTKVKRVTAAFQRWRHVDQFHAERRQMCMTRHLWENGLISLTTNVLIEYTLLEGYSFKANRSQTGTSITFLWRWKIMLCFAMHY